MMTERAGGTSLSPTAPAGPTTTTMTEGATPDTTDGAAAASGALAWGDNSAGELGDASVVRSAVPVSVTSLSGIRAIAAGGRHALALLANGTIMAWGDNTFGQLGNGTTTVNRSSPVPVLVQGLSGVVAVSCGGEHSLALLKNGTVMAWGQNLDGQLGNGIITLDSTVPLAVHGLSGVTAIAAGHVHSLALLANGTVQVWGSNGYYQLGQTNTFPGGIGQSAVPVAVPGLSGVHAIAAGGLFNLALLTTGTVLAWGDNALGQLGNGTTTDVITAATVSGLSTVTAVSAGTVQSLVAQG